MRLRQVELFMILCALGILGIVVISITQRQPRRGMGHARINCLNNLKQVNLAQKIWAGDNNDKYPFEVSTNSGGTKEYVKAGDTFRHFAAMSNELGTPKILICRMDTSRQPVTDFASLSNSNLSYFINLAARERGPVTVSFGDRNLLVSGSGTNLVVKWGAGLHEKVGNIALSDGSTHATDPFSTNALNPRNYLNAQLLFPP